MKKIVSYSLMSLIVLFAAPGSAVGDSLWNIAIPATHASFYGDQQVVRRGVNDIIFVLIDETTLANVESQHDLEASSKADGDWTNWFSVVGWTGVLDFLKGGNQNNIQATQTASENLPKWGFEVDNEFEGQASSNRQSSVKTKIAARIIEVMPNGNLVLEAKRTLNVNSEKLRIAMTGEVRSSDIDVKNQVESSKIAELNFSVKGEGDVTNATKPGIVYRFFDYLR